MIRFIYYECNNHHVKYVFYLLIGGGDGLQDDSLHLLASSQAAGPPHLPQTQQSQDSRRLWRSRTLHLSRREVIQ